MNKLYSILTFLILFTPTAFSQDTSWTFKNNLGANFTQIALSNWAGGGQNAVTIIGLFNGTANYKKGDVAWENALELGFGLTKLDTAKTRKSDDRIVFISKYTKGITTKAPLNYAVLVDFRTQFAPGRDYTLASEPKISNFFAPAYLTTSLGIEYKPTEYLSLLISPITGRTTFVLDDTLSSIGAFGVEKGKKFNEELGWLFNAQFKKEIFSNVTLQSRLNLFNNYETLGQIIANSETLLIFKINDYVNASYALDLFYDQNVPINRDNNKGIGPATQIRSTLAIGFNYAF